MTDFLAMDYVRFRVVIRSAGTLRSDCSLSNVMSDDSAHGSVGRMNTYVAGLNAASVVGCRFIQQLSGLHWISDDRMVLCHPRRQGSDQLGSDFAPGVADGDRVAKHTSLTSLMCWAVSMTLLALNSLQHFEQNWCLNHNEMSLLPKIGNQPLVKSPVVVRTRWS